MKTTSLILAIFLASSYQTFAGDPSDKGNKEEEFVEEEGKPTDDGGGKHRTPQSEEDEDLSRWRDISEEDYNSFRDTTFREDSSESGRSRRTSGDDEVVRRGGGGGSSSSRSFRSGGGGGLFTNDMTGDSSGVDCTGLYDEYNTHRTPKGDEIIRRRQELIRKISGSGKQQVIDGNGRSRTAQDETRRRLRTPQDDETGRRRPRTPQDQNIAKRPRTPQDSDRRPASDVDDE